MTPVIPHYSRISQVIFFLFAFMHLSPICAAHARGSARNLFASSTTAQSITGNITIDDNIIKMARAFFKVKNLGLTNQYPTFLGTDVTATIYKVINPKNPSMLNGNKICIKNIRWYVIYEHNNKSQSPNTATCLSAFQSKEKPLSDNQSGFCAGFCYLQ